MEKLKVGVIGLGYWGKILCRTIVGSERMVLHAVADRHPENRALYPDAQQFLDSFKLIESPEVELVVIATQAASHEALVRHALTQGKNVFVEKPFTGSYDTAKDLSQLAQSKGLRIFVDMPYLFSKKMTILRSELAKKTVLLVKMRRCDFGKFPRDADIFSHLMFHDLYIVHFLFGLSEELQGLSVACGQLLSPWHSDWGVVSFNLSPGQKIHIINDMTSIEKIRKIEFFCTDGQMQWDDLKIDWLSIETPRSEFVQNQFQYLSPLVVSNNKGIENDDPLAQQMSAIADALGAGEVLWNESDTFLKVLSSIEGIREKAL